MTLWTDDDGTIDVTSAFQGFTQPLSEIIDDIHGRGWTVNKIAIKDDQYVAEGKNPHGEKLEAFGRTDATAAGNLLVKIMRREHMRSSALRVKLGAWDHRPIEQQLPVIAQAYVKAKSYDPKAASAWMDLAQDCQRRSDIIQMQIAMEITDDPVPYQTADEMREDVTKKRHIWISRAYAHHPIWSERQMLDYRLMVDVLGHSASGGDWGWHGACLAFAALAPLLAEAPQKALFTEMLGQTAYGATYRAWGPQKIAFLEDEIEKLQKQNPPGHAGVHPSQSLVPGAMPRIFTKVAAGDQLDPNADWDSGITPLPDNAYMWQRQNDTDPLDIHTHLDGLRQLEPGIAKMHPEMARQAVVNSLRQSVLGSRTNPMGHAVHYQDVMHMPAGVDDPIAFWDAFERSRENHNQGQGYAPGAHKQHWAQQKQFEQWVRTMNPQLDDGQVSRLAKRELLHMLTEEEERILAADEGEQMPAELVEHEAYEALRTRLKALTKPTVDQKVDFGDSSMYHEANDGRLMYHISPYPNRDSIQSGGLRARQPDYSTEPWYDPAEWPEGGIPRGVYLYDHPEAFEPGGSWPRGENHDIWAVDTTGLHLEPDDAMGMSRSWYSPEDIPGERVRPYNLAPSSRTSTYHAGMYPPYLASSLRPLAAIGRHADTLAQAAQEDLLNHRGRGHHFRSTALQLGIPKVGPRQISNAWLHLAPQTSALAVVNPEVADVLGHQYQGQNNDRDYFRHERELAAGRDAAGYNHVPLGAFSSAMYDMYVGGPGWHPDRTPFKALGPTPVGSVDWNAQATPMNEASSCA